MKRWLYSALRLAAGAVFIVASMYSLLAFLPYTYLEIVKFPPYAWVAWFAQHFGWLYLVAVAVWAATDAVASAKSFWKYGLVLLPGFYFLWCPELRDISNGIAAYGWSVCLLIPLALLVLSGKSILGTAKSDVTGNYSVVPAVVTAVGVSVLYGTAAAVERVQRPGGVSGTMILALAVWTLVSHALVAIFVVAVLHLIAVLAIKTQNAGRTRLILTGVAAWAALAFLLTRSLNVLLSFGGWRAALYSAALAGTLVLWGMAVIWPGARMSATENVDAKAPTRRLILALIFVSSAFIALYAPKLIGGSDWNGIFRSLLTFAFWIVATACVYAVWPKQQAAYSAVQIFGVLVVTSVVFGSMCLTQIYWSRALGSTDDEIELALVEYGGQDASFQMVNSLLGDTHRETCGDLCRILREYTNVRNAHTATEIDLTPNLTAARGPVPNIFLFVIDSMRPDYIGAYNPQVDFTPNLDALARDGIAFHNVYSQYAGTSLSEPAIWAGATLLHAHYLQPFSQLNSLDRMLQADGYQRIVSMDEILGELLPKNSGIIELDKDKKSWNELEIGSTLQQLEQTLDQRTGQQPIFFYAQPKNVHQFARNHLPMASAVGWKDRPGFNTRITYEVHGVDESLGKFFAYLKQRGLYENSIIMVTSDHGDATGEFGRTSHSTSIWPEIMRVPLIVRLPQKMRAQLVYEDSRVSSLTDITPTLYQLLGHRPIEHNPMYGRPLLAETKSELDDYPQRDLLLASDVRAVYGMLAQNGRYLYVTYDSPAQSYLFDLAADPNAQHNLLNPSVKQAYDQEIIQHLQQTASFYGYHPGVDSLLAATNH